MAYIYNDLIPAFIPKDTITTILNIINNYKPRSIIEFMPGAGPLTWHILTNFDFILSYHAVDKWESCGRKKLKRDGIDGVLDKSLFLKYNNFKNLTYEQNDFIKFTNEDNFDLWIFDHDVAEDYYQNKSNIIFDNIYVIFNKIKKDKFLLFYQIEHKVEFRKAINKLIDMLSSDICYIDNDVIMIRKTL